MDLKFVPKSIDVIAIDKLRPYEKNPRLHSKEQVAKIASSISEFGWTLPVLIDDDNEIIAGHGRVLAAKKLGITDVPTIRMRHLSEEQIKAYRITDNQTVIAGDWDSDALLEEITILKDVGFDLNLLGFDPFELQSILDFGPTVDPLVDEDAVPDEPSTPVTRVGDVWILGNHRLLCGDSTKADDVARCLNDEKPHLMVTDPPYGVDYDPEWRNKAIRADESKIGGRALGLVKNDKVYDWRDAYALFPGEVAYIWCASLHILDVGNSIIECGFELRSSIIWVKGHIAIGRGHYHWQHEPCWYAVRKGGTGHWQGDRKQSTVWQIDKPRKSETGHSTQKPVECMRKPMENNSARGDRIYEPFMGSGTSLIAAEQTGRKCHGIEIEEKYCDVAVKRWQEYSGKVAVLEGDGRSFSDISDERLVTP